MATVAEKTPGNEVLFERAGAHVAIVTLNRPQVRNAVNGDLAIAMERHVQRIEEDDSIRVAILAAAGTRSFCAGADLAEVAAGRAASLFTPAGGFAGFMDAVRSKPWIAAVDSDAFGGGFELCLCCDLIVAAEHVRFALPEVRRGLFAGVAAQRLPHALPRNVALELMISGAPMEAKRAQELGMVNRVVAPGTARAAAIALAESIAANAPLSVRGSLAVARIAAGSSSPELRAAYDAAVERISRSADSQEGPRAFLEKRTPVWRGA